MAKSVAFVETSTVSYEDIKATCGEIIPDCKIIQIVDDSLIPELTSNGGPTKATNRRLYTYYQMAESLGVDLIVNQCAIVGEVVEQQIRPFMDTPIIRLDEAMARKAVTLGRKIAVIATTECTTGSSVRIIERMAKEMGKEVEVDLHLVDGAMLVLIEKGDKELHNRMVLDEVLKAAEDNDVIVLAQGSMVVLLPLLEDLGKPVLYPVRLGIEYVKQLLNEE